MGKSNYCITFSNGFGLGGVAAVVRSSTIGPPNNRTNKRNKERGVKNNRAATYSGPMKIQAFEKCYSTVWFT